MAASHTRAALQWKDFDKHKIFLCFIVRRKIPNPVCKHLFLDDSLTSNTENSFRIF